MDRERTREAVSSANRGVSIPAVLAALALLVVLGLLLVLRSGGDGGGQATGGDEPTGLVPTVTLIERTLLPDEARGDGLRGEALFARVRDRLGISLGVLAQLYAMREGSVAWPDGELLDDLVGATLRDLDALVAWIDSHAHDPIDSPATR